MRCGGVTKAMGKKPLNEQRCAHCYPSLLTHHGESTLLLPPNQPYQMNGLDQWQNASPHCRNPLDRFLLVSTFRMH